MTKILQKFKQDIDNKTLYVAIGFTVFCSLFGFYLFHDYYLNLYEYTKIHHFNSKVIGFQLINFIIDFVLFIVYAYYLFNSKLWIKIPFLILLVVCISAELGYISFYDRFSDPNDIIIALTATGEQVNSLMSQYLNFNILTLLFAFAVGEIVLRSRKKTANFLVLIYTLILFTLHSVSSFFIYSYLSTKHEDIIAYNINQNVFIPLPVGINTFINTCFGYLIVGDKDFKTERDRLSYQTQVKPLNNIVIIMEETIRGDYLSLNGYPRKTSGYLEELRNKHLLKNFGLCVAGSTASLTSNNLLFAGISPSNADAEISKKTFTSPSIFQYAKATNYKTYFFDAQMNDYWAGTFDDYTFIDHYFNKKQLLPEGVNNFEIDFIIAEQVNKILKNSRGNLIYIVKRGFHFPYESNYPENKRIWVPVFEGDLSTDKDQKGLINSYDNSLSYNIDRFFKVLIGNSEESLNHSIIIYTGDHGENFLEDGESVGHSKSSKLEATVPLVIIGKNIEADTLYKASHHNILPTVLDLMNYPKNEIKYHYSPSLLQAKESDNKKRHYILPDLNNPKVYDFDN